MWSDCSRSFGPAECTGMDLQVIWDVKADASYDVHCGNAGVAPTLIAVRTQAGHGSMIVDQHEPLELTPGSLLVVERAAIRRYRTHADRWQFWWFEFTLSGPLPFPLYRLLQIAPQAGDRREFSAIFAGLRRETYLHRSLASAAFNRLMYRWLTSWEGTLRRSPHSATIKAVIAAMHARLAENWTVAAMAEFAHLSERRFRQVFRQETGQAPKPFYDHLRLTMAREMLRQGIYNVREVAARLGFTDAFHFSKVFKQFCGAPPSRIET